MNYVVCLLVSPEIFAAMSPSNPTLRVNLRLVHFDSERRAELLSAFPTLAPYLAPGLHALIFHFQVIKDVCVTYTRVVNEEMHS